MNRVLRLTVLPCALAAALTTAAAGAAQAPPDVEELVRRVGERVAEFYRRAQTVVCIEKSTVQPLGSNFSPDGFARTVESELHVEPEGGDPPGSPAVVRQVLKVNGRRPRDSDRKDREGCTDPNPVSTEPLTFLLPSQRAEYRFKWAGLGKMRNRDAVLIDFETVDRKNNPELIEDKSGHDDCFDWTGHVASTGRLWVDSGTYDVLGLERRNRGPVDVNVPVKIQRRYHLNSYVVVEREDVTIHYRPVVFSDPDETLLLPESIDSVIMVRGGLQSTRRSQVFSGYKRFLTEGKVLK